MCFFSRNVLVVVGGNTGNIKIVIVGDRGSECRCSVINVCRLGCRGSRWCLCSHKSRWCYCVVGWDSGVAVGHWGRCVGCWVSYVNGCPIGQNQKN